MLFGRRYIAYNLVSECSTSVPVLQVFAVVFLTGISGSNSALNYILARSFPNQTESDFGPRGSKTS